MRTGTIDLAELSPLQAAIARLREVRGHEEPVAGTHHTLVLSDLRPRSELGSGHQLTPAFERLVLATRLLRAAFDAPTDEPSRVGR